MTISPHMLEKNREHYNRQKLEYPFEIVTQHYARSKLSPAKFGALHKTMDFVEVPLEDGMHWLFRSADDLAIFKRWRITHTREH